MVWNWQLPNWPEFSYNPSAVNSLEKKFLQDSGGAFAVLKHLDEEKKRQFIVETLCIEGLKSAEIEGEILERESLQSSIQRHFGLALDVKKSTPVEQGMGDLLCEMYDTYDVQLSHEMLYNWHSLLMQNETKQMDIGKYRSHKDPMQIVSGRLDAPNVFFEAPPSDQVYKEMTDFIKWYNHNNDESVLGKAAVMHAYFESIHPFEDGNGRLGRALVEKILSQKLGQPILIAISPNITKKKKEYYASLGSCNRTLDIERWVIFFAEIIVESQEASLMLINFLMVKSKLLRDLQGKINDRQEKALLRMFDEGIKGFSGGLSAENYMKITKASRPTATRDLSDLVRKKALVKTGQLRYTRYNLNLDY